ncbi:MAG: contact-dependent growth inhibition system immunity protein [Bacteroidota bacterium]
MKKTNWARKTLESLEKNVWPELSEMDKQDWLMVECNALRKKPIKDFTIENLRQMIEQDIGLEFLIPVALEELEQNILAEGECYPGDLLCNVLRSDKNYWATHQKSWEKVCALFKANEQLLQSFETTWEIRKLIFDRYARFSNLN